jgi:signal transduction histidine kinase
LPAGLASFGRAALGHLGRAAAAYGVLVVGVLLTLLATRFVSQTVEAQERVRFDEAAVATKASVDRRINASYVDTMLGADGLFAASANVSREEWANYTRAIDLESRYEGLQALGYAPRVAPEEREAFVDSVREEGVGDFGTRLGVRSPDGEEGAYFPLTYVEPLTEANAATLGDDLYAVPAYRAAMDEARDTNSPRATGKVYLISETGPNSVADLALKKGFLVFVPIYGQGEPSASGRDLTGFIVGAVRTDDMLREIFGQPLDPAVDLEVYDGRVPTADSLLYDRDGVERAGEDVTPRRQGIGGALAWITGLPLGETGRGYGFSWSDNLFVAGHEWTLYLEALRGFEEQHADEQLPLFVFLSGLGVSLLLFGVTYMLVRSRVRAQMASRKLEDANRELESTNRELESFSYSVSHDLRAPLRSIDGFSQILLEDYADDLDEDGKAYLGRVRSASQRMGHLIDDLLGLSRVTRGAIRRERVDLSSIGREVARSLMETDRVRTVEFLIEDGLEIQGDERLVRVALENLLGNAFKFTGKEPEARIEFGKDPGLTARGRVPVYYVRDNGAGFDEAYAGKLFGAFQRLHGQDEFDGTGIGLATVQRVVHRHGGRIWAEGKVGEGATFYLTLRPGLQFDPVAVRDDGQGTGAAKEEVKGAK